jgi:hypothetical protein
MSASLGFQAGDGYVQHNTSNFLFGGSQPDGPVVAGADHPPAAVVRRNLASAREEGGEPAERPAG